MGTNNYTDYSSTPVNQTVADRMDQYFNGSVADIVPRNSSGVPEADAGKCGTAVYPFSEGNFTTINIGGTPFDPQNLLTDKNQVRSGAVRSGSSQPLFLQADGSANELTILATTTNLVLTINGAAVTFDTDVDVAALTVAPSSNNTCLVNNTDLSDQDFTKYITEIDYDTAGSEITALHGEFAAFKLSSEYFIAKIDNTNSKLKVYQRGFFFDSTNAPIDREVISDGDTITLMSLAWVYADNSGSSASVGYTTPIYASTAPSSPATNDYWYDVTNQQWKRYDGAAWQVVNRILIGYAVIDTANCVATRCVDFSKVYSSDNTFRLEKATASTLQTITDFENTISVYGNNFYYNGRLTWDMATDLESGVTEAADTIYYFYITDEGGVKISDEAPNYFRERGGGYHPFHTWRFVARGVNDSSFDLTSQVIHFAKNELIVFEDDDFLINPNGLINALVYGIGAQENSNSIAGGSTIFDFDLIAKGGGSTDISNGDLIFAFDDISLDQFLLIVKGVTGEYGYNPSTSGLDGGEFVYKKYSLSGQYSYQCQVGKVFQPTISEPWEGALIIQLL